MSAHPLAAHREGLAAQLLAHAGHAQLNQLIDAAKRILVHLEAVRNTRRVAQTLNAALLQRRIRPQIDFKTVPVPVDPGLGVDRRQHLFQVALQLCDKAFTNLAALDGDFREKFDDQFHGAGVSCAKRCIIRAAGARRSANCRVQRAPSWVASHTNCTNKVLQNGANHRFMEQKMSRMGLSANAPKWHTFCSLVMQPNGGLSARRYMRRQTRCLAKDSCWRKPCRKRCN